MEKNITDKTGARGVPRSAHNHALTSAISHMQLGIILNDHKLFRKAFKNYEHAIRYQRKNGSLPIEVRRGGKSNVLSRKGDECSFSYSNYC